MFAINQKDPIIVYYVYPEQANDPVLRKDYIITDDIIGPTISVLHSKGYITKDASSGTPFMQCINAQEETKKELVVAPTNMEMSSPYIKFDDSININGIDKKLKENLPYGAGIIRDNKVGLCVYMFYNAFYKPEVWRSLWYYDQFSKIIQMNIDLYIWATRLKPLNKKDCIFFRAI